VWLIVSEAHHTHSQRIPAECLQGVSIASVNWPGARFTGVRATPLVVLLVLMWVVTVHLGSFVCRSQCLGGILLDVVFQESGKRSP